MNDTSTHVTVRELVDRGILERPMDGNHGEIHPKGEDFVPTGVPFITAADVKDGRVDVHGCAFISTRQAGALRKGFAKLGDVLLTHKATIGRTAIIDEIPAGLDWIVLTPQVTYYRVLRKDVLEPRYLKYYFDSPTFQTLLEAWSGGGSTRAYLGITKQLDLPIQLFPIEKQRAIVSILGVLDDKIEQNRRTGRVLEELARATFKAWFVDFEPVRAKTAGATSFPGMSSAAFAALPDRLADSPVGPVPEGWEVRQLSEVCQFVSGGTPKRSEADYWGGDIPWYSVKDAPSDGMPWVYFTDEQITQAGLDGSAATLVPVGCTIISARGTVGRLALVGRPMTFNQSCYGLLPADGASYRHLNLLVREIVTELQQRTHGSVFDTITRQTFDSVSVVRPPSALLEPFEQIVAPYFDLLLASLKESQKLAELRDYLLPRLLSGSVRAEVRRG